jgi:hypothetical protein
MIPADRNGCGLPWSNKQEHTVICFVCLALSLLSFPSSDFASSIRKDGEPLEQESHVSLPLDFKIELLEHGETHDFLTG